jgi:hypothetical protein
MPIQEQQISTFLSAPQEPTPTANTNRQPERVIVATMLRGEDALMRAATEVAAPHRRFVATLLDAHADTAARAAALRRGSRALGSSSGVEPARRVLARLLEESEEQLHRLETVLALLRERPAAHAARLTTAGLAYPASEAAERHVPALLRALAEEEQRGAADARAMRDLAYLAGHHMAARLLDLTAEERQASARAIAAASAHH